jgi:catechol 2,3-dioxygenase-like lactoylglutathione lyase family enzyme
MMTTAFGQFLEFSVPTYDIQESLNFYHKLGFSELPVGDIRDYHYAVITDGRIAIGLHADGIDEPALSFVKSDVAASLRSVAPDEELLSFSRLGSETFHEIGVHTPDGHLLIMMEARTFSRAHLSELPTPATGHSVEISLGCRDIDSSAHYWTDAGFTMYRPMVDDSPGDTIELLTPGLRLGLRTDLPSGRTALRFAPDDLDHVLELLDQQNVPVHRAGKCHRVTAPEGTHLNLYG